MEEFLFILFITLFIILFVKTGRLKRNYNSLLARLLVLEKRDNAPEETEQPDAQPHSSTSVESISHIMTGEIAADTPAEIQQQTAPSSENPVSDFLRSNRFKSISNRFMENWIAVLAVLVLVAGISYFGIWASSRVSSELRFGLVVLASLVLFGISCYPYKNNKYRNLGEWLRSAAGAVYLFAALGAGGIPGLQWINNPLFALVFLLTGVAANLALSFLVANQYFSGLHVILSLTALAVAPQNAVTLFVAAVITLVGLSLSIRRKADIHHLLTLLVFFLFVFYWGWKADTTLAFYNMSAFGIVLLTGAMTLIIHYRGAYAHRDFDILPFTIHLLNWLFVAIAIIRFSPGVRYTSIPLFTFALALFVLARYGHRLGIRWLYLSDTMIAQLMTILSFIALVKVEVNLVLVFLIVLAETVIFQRVIRIEGNRKLLTFGAWLVVFASTALVLYSTASHISSAFYNRHIMMASLYAGIALLAFYLSSMTDIPGDKTEKKQGKFQNWLLNAALFLTGFSVFLCLISIFYTAIRYKLLPKYLSPDTLTLLPFVLLLWLRYRIYKSKHKDQSGAVTAGMTIGLYCHVVLTGAFSLLNSLFTSFSDSGQVALYFLPVFSVAASLAVFSGFPLNPALKTSGPRAVINPGIVFSVLSFVIFIYQVFVPHLTLPVGSCWMLLSCTCLYTATMKKEIPDPVDKRFPGHTLGIRRTLAICGFALLPLIIIRFFLFDSYSSILVFERIPARYGVETLLIATLLFWFIRSRHLSGTVHSTVEKTSRRFLEVVSVCAVIILYIESRRQVFPVLLTLYSILLVLISTVIKRDRDYYSRLLLHSLFTGWLACLSLVFVYGPFYYPSLKFGSQPWLLALSALLLLFIHVALMHRFFSSEYLIISETCGFQHRAAAKILQKRRLFVFYPVFIAMAFFFIWSFNRSLLTVLLCVEVFAIFILSILLRENHFRYLSMFGLLACLVRLVMYDLAGSHTLTKALVCMAMALIMLGMNILYNRFKDRYTPEENQKC